MRVVVENTVRSLKRGFPGSLLPVRGLIRARMMLYLAALMVNVRRLHRYRAATDEEENPTGPPFLSIGESALRRCSQRLQYYLLATLLAVEGQKAALAPG